MGKGIAGQDCTRNQSVLSPKAPSNHAVMYHCGYHSIGGKIGEGGKGEGLLGELYCPIMGEGKGFECGNCNQNTQRDSRHRLFLVRTPAKTKYKGEDITHVMVCVPIKSAAVSYCIEATAGTTTALF